MALNFPIAPAIGDKHSENGLTWSWMGDRWDLVSPDFVEVYDNTAVYQPDALVVFWSDPLDVRTSSIYRNVSGTEQEGVDPTQPAWLLVLRGANDEGEILRDPTDDGQNVIEPTGDNFPLRIFQDNKHTKAAFVIQTASGNQVTVTKDGRVSLTDNKSAVRAAIRPEGRFVASDEAGTTRASVDAGVAADPGSAKVRVGDGTGTDRAELSGDGDVTVYFEDGQEAGILRAGSNDPLEEAPALFLNKFQTGTTAPTLSALLEAKDSTLTLFDDQPIRRMRVKGGDDPYLRLYDDTGLKRVIVQGNPNQPVAWLAVSDGTNETRLTVRDGPNTFRPSISFTASNKSDYNQQLERATLNFSDTKAYPQFDKVLYESAPGAADTGIWMALKPVPAQAWSWLDIEDGGSTNNYWRLISAPAQVVPVSNFDPREDGGRPTGSLDDPIIDGPTSVSTVGDRIFAIAPGQYDFATGTAVTPPAGVEVALGDEFVFDGNNWISLVTADAILREPTDGTNIIAPLVDVVPLTVTQVSTGTELALDIMAANASGLSVDSAGISKFYGPNSFYIDQANGSIVWQNDKDVTGDLSFTPTTAALSVIDPATADKTTVEVSADAARPTYASPTWGNVQLERIMDFHSPLRFYPEGDKVLQETSDGAGDTGIWVALVDVLLGPWEWDDIEGGSSGKDHWRLVSGASTAGPVGDANAVSEIITELGYSARISLGDQVYRNTATGEWDRASASSETTLKRGMVTKIIDALQFEVTYFGIYQYAAAHGFTLGETYYLSNLVGSEGGVTSDPPTDVGSFQQAAFEVIDPVRILVLNQAVSQNQFPVFTDPTFRTSAVYEEVTSAGHGFGVGDNLAYDGTTGWVLASARNAATLKTGIVSAVVDADTFEITYSGQMLWTGPALTVGATYYLADDGTGGNVLTPPNNSLSYQQATIKVLSASLVTVIDQAVLANSNLAA